VLGVQGQRERGCRRVDIRLDALPFHGSATTPG